MKELDPTKPVQLRDGRQVRNVCWDYLLSNGMIGISAIVRTNDNEHDFCQLWYSNGIVYQGTSDNSNDLINVPERIEGWVNVFENIAPRKYFGNTIYATREEAIKNAD